MPDHQTAKLARTITIGAILGLAGIVAATDLFEIFGTRKLSALPESAHSGLSFGLLGLGFLAIALGFINFLKQPK